MKPMQTLYCLADEAGFRLCKTDGSGLEEVVKTDAKTLADVEQVFTHERGRTHSATSSFGHETQSEAEAERPRLARHVVAALEAEWDAGSYDRIVLVAGPKMLGALRTAMPKALAPHISAELHKDLMGASLHDLEGHFRTTPH